MNPVEQIFKLHRLLKGTSEGVSRQRLQEELECSPATAKRVLARLRDYFGAPLYFDRDLGGYRYRDDAFELPGLWFSAAELSALLVLHEVLDRQPLGLLAETLRPLRARVERLAGESGVGIPEWRTRLRLLRTSARASGEHFERIAEALARRQRLAIDYHARSNDRMAPRQVSPQRLTLYRDNWYLDAWCHERKDLRIFALDRIIAAEVLTAGAIDVEAERLNQTLATSYGIFSGAPTALARLRFSAHAARWVAAETWHPQQHDHIDDDRRLVRELPYHRDDELLMDLLRHGADVEVLAPATLREQLLARLRAALDQYAAGG